MIEELYKKKLIRDFLSLFSESKWKDLIYLSLEYGIILLKRNFNVASLSLDDLTTILDDLKEEENKRIKQNMKKFDKEVTLERNRVGRSGSKSKVSMKPSSDWRKGDETVFEQVRDEREDAKKKKESKERRIQKSTLEKILKQKQETNNIVQYSNIYPEWWGDVKKRQHSLMKKNKLNRQSSKNRTRVGQINQVTQEHFENPGYYSDTKKTQIASKEKFRINSNSSTKDRIFLNNPNFDKHKLREIESKIKPNVQTDKKIFHLLKHQNKDIRDTRENFHDANDANYSEEEYRETQNNENNEDYYEDQDRHNDEEQFSNAAPEDKYATKSSQNYNQNNNSQYQSQSYTGNSQHNESRVTHNEIDEGASYLRESQSSSYNRQYYNNQLSKASEKRLNYAIEYDKNLQPQIIKEKDKTKANHKVKTSSNSNRNFPGEQPHLNPSEISNFEQNSNHTKPYTSNAFESIYNSQATNRHEDTILREQVINKYIGNNNKGSYNRIPSSFTNNFYNNEEELNLSTNNSHNIDSYNRQINNNNYAGVKSNRDAGEVLSPHFNNYIKYERKADEDLTPEYDKITNYQNNLPFTIQNEEFVKPAEKSSSNLNKLNRCNQDLNESEMLSSYSPSERTKKFFQKDVLKNPLTESRNSAQKNNRHMVINSSNINDSMADSQNNSVISSQRIYQSYNPGNNIPLTIKLNEKDLQKYNSSNESDEEEIYTSKRRPEVRTLHIEDMRRNNDDEEGQSQNDIKNLRTFNSKAEDLNFRIQKLMNKK